VEHQSKGEMMEVRTKTAYWCKCKQTHHPHKGIKNEELHGKGLADKAVPTVDKFCCTDMEEAYNDEFISLGNYETGATYDRDGNLDNAQLNIFKCSPYPEGACWGEMAIRFCPFCGEAITIKHEV
jgi:hypothetical protein